MRFVCKCAHANQTKNDLIKLVYKASDGTDTIKWINTFTSDYQIVLKTELEFKKVDNIKKVNDSWNFEITLKTDPDALLPLNSKVSLDILDETTQEWYIANCIATNETFLICDSNSEVTAQPKLVYLKSLNSSVTWKNKNKQDYEKLESATDDPNEPEPTIIKTENIGNTDVNTDNKDDNTDNKDDNTDNKDDNTDNKDDNTEKNPSHTEGVDKNVSNYLGDIKFYLLFILILV